MAAQQPEQAVGHGMEQQPELVGQETVAAQAIGLEIQLQFLDAVFHVAPEHVEVVVDKLGIAAQVGDYKALIGAQASVFHLGDDPAGLVPGIRLVHKGSQEALFFSSFLVALLGLFQQCGSLGKKPVVGDEADDVAEIRLLLQIAINRRHGKAGIGPEKDQGLGVSLPQLFDQPFEYCQRPLGGMSVAGAQHRGQGKAVAAVKDEERVVHVLFIIPVKEALLLVAVGGVIGGIHVQDDDLAGAGMGLEIEVQQPIGEAAQVPGVSPVLKPGESGLGGQVRGTLRGLAGHDLEGRVLSQAGGIVVVFVTQGNGEQPLPHQGEKIVSHSGGIPGIMKAAGSIFS